MKNTSIFIPLLLIGCLAALIYLFFAALSAAEDNEASQPDRIVLNEEDYRAPGTADPDALDVEKAEEKDKSYATYFEEVPEDEKVLPRERTSSNQENTDLTARHSSPRPEERTTTSAPSTDYTPAAPTRSSSSSSNTTAASRNTSSGGRYLVLAGSFVQASGADTRVAALRAAGFRDARTERFNRGTYAVALAGQYDSYSRAKQLADQLTAKGFESEVMKRR